MSSFTDNITDFQTEASRDVVTPSYWIPRWMSAAYDKATTESPTTKVSNITLILNALVSSTKEEISRIELGTSFNQSLWYPRNAYTAAINLINPSTLTLSSAGTGHVTGVIRQAKSISEVLSICYEPCFAVNDSGGLLLRNIDLFDTSVTPDADGVIDLTTAFQTHPPIPDTPIIVANAWGDTFVISPEIPLTNNNLIPMGYQGDYRVRYSTTIFRSAVTSSALISFAGDTFKAHRIDLKNVVDEYAYLLGLTRIDDEDNITLRKRCQTLSLSKSSTQQISSAIGKSVPFVWDGVTTINISASGGGSPNIIGTSWLEHIVENPSYVNGNFVLSREPWDQIKVYANNQVFDALEYSISGSLLIPQSSALANINPAYLKVAYYFNPYTTSIGETQITVSSKGGSPALFYGVVPTGVRIAETTKYTFDFSWGGSESGNLGGSSFD